VISSDCNAALIGLYKNIQGRCEELIQWLTDIGSDVSEERYYELRLRFNELEDKECLEASALMLILNKTGFRGMYREGPRGLNIPYGNYKNPGIFDAAQLHEVAELVRGVEFRCTDYYSVLGVANAGDYVYLDPPYAPEVATSFVGYNAGGFMDHETLFASIRCLPCNWLMSNSSVPAVYTAFGEYNIRVVEARRAINSRNPGAVTNEVLITNQSELHAS
jgi:DNA adenine methylase